MSGGSMDYLCYKVDVATFSCNTPERKAFLKHLKLVAKALHDIEWVDSSDMSDGDESEAIRACLSRTDVLDAAIEDAKQAQFNLTNELNRLTKIGKAAELKAYEQPTMHTPSR